MWNELTLGRKLDAVSLALLLLILLLLGGTGLMSHRLVGPVLATGTLPGGWAVHLHDRAVSALFALIYLRLGLGLFIGGFGWTWFGWALLLVVGVPATLIGQAASGLQGHGWYGLVAGNVMARAPVLDGLTKDWMLTAFARPESLATSHAVAEGLLVVAGAGLLAANAGRLSGLITQQARRQAVWFAAAILGAGWLLARLMSLPLPLDNPDNAAIFKPMETPERILPDWYLSPWFAMLRSASTREGGSLISWASLLVLLPVSLLVWAHWRSRVRLAAFLAAGVASAGFIALAMIGRQPPEPEWIAVSSYVTIGYFVYFLLVLPLLSVLDLVWSRAGRTAAMASSEPR